MKYATEVAIIGMIYMPISMTTGSSIRVILRLIPK
jgi:hypothetical protein